MNSQDVDVKYKIFKHKLTQLKDKKKNQNFLDKLLNEIDSLYIGSTKNTK